MSVPQRMARWILMTRDRVNSNEFPITQEFLALMLGVRTGRRQRGSAQPAGTQAHPPTAAAPSPFSTIEASQQLPAGATKLSKTSMPRTRSEGNFPASPTQVTRGLPILAMTVGPASCPRPRTTFYVPFGANGVHRGLDCPRIAARSANVAEERREGAKEIEREQQDVAVQRRDVAEATANRNYEVALAKAEGDYKVAKELREPLSGSAQTSCRDQAELVLESAKTRAELLKTKG